MSVKWVTASKGVRYREHPSRKYGIRPDRYYVIFYKQHGKTKNESLGWETDNKKTGESLQKRAERLLAILRENWRTGQGPQSLAEMRQEAENTRKEKDLLLEREGLRLITLDTFFEEHFKPLAIRSKKTCSYEKEFEYYRNWIKPLLGSTPLVHINLASWEILLSPLDRQKKTIATKRYVCGTLCRILRCAQDRGHDVKIPSMKQLGVASVGNNRRTRVISEHEMRIMLSMLRERDINAYYIVYFAMVTGCRFSEAASLTWGDISETNGITFKETKNKTNRTIPFSIPLSVLLKEIGRKEDSSYVFLNMSGKPYTQVPTSFKKIIIKLKLNEGRDRYDRLSFHSLRHTAATLMAKYVDLRSLMDILGWKSINMAARYMHGDEERKKKALDMIGSMLEEKNPTKIIKFDASEAG